MHDILVMKLIIISLDWGGLYNSISIKISTRASARANFQAQNNMMFITCSSRKSTTSLDAILMPAFFNSATNSSISSGWCSSKQQASTSSSFHIPRKVLSHSRKQYFKNCTVTSPLWGMRFCLGLIAGLSFSSITWKIMNNMLSSCVRLHRLLSLLNPH